MQSNVRTFKEQDIGIGELVIFLKPQGYAPCKITVGLWKHTNHPISIFLMVDDFGIKHVGETHPDHLIIALWHHYILSLYRAGKHYLNVSLKWDHKNCGTKQKAKLSMPEYIKNCIFKAQHAPPEKINPHHITSIQNMRQRSNTPTIRINPQNYHPQISLKFHWCLGWSYTIVYRLKQPWSMYSAKFPPHRQFLTQKTSKAVTKLLNYTDSNPYEIIHFQISDIHLRL